MSTSSRFQVRLWSPTPEQVEYFRATEVTRRFLQNLPDDVRRKFAGQWIAAKNCEIMASAPTRAALFEKLAKPDDPLVLKLRLERGVTIRWRHPL